MDYPGRIIKRGEKDSNIIKSIQVRLNQKGFGPLAPDGVFGAGTESAIRQFQSLNIDSWGNPLLIDGKLGTISWSVLFGVDAGRNDEDYVQPRLFTQVLELASSQVGVVEQPPGSNRGPEVEKYLRSTGCSPGDPWCASFVYWCFNEASKSIGIQNPLVRTGSCMTHLANTRGTKISLRQALKRPSVIKPGFIFLIDHGCGKGHTGIVKSAGDGFISTVEGNTAIDGSREGLGVSELQRKINSINAGFIDYSQY